MEQEHLSVEEYKREVGLDPGEETAPEKPAPKYRNVKTWGCPDCGSQAIVPHDDKMHAACCGVYAVVFDSKFEADRWAELKLEEKLGSVRKLQRQVKIVISFEGRVVKYKPSNRPMSYIADFVYESFDGSEWVGVVEDTKGFDTKDSKIKRALVCHMTGTEVFTHFKATRNKHHGSA